MFMQQGNSREAEQVSDFYQKQKSLINEMRRIGDELHGKITYYDKRY